AYFHRILGLYEGQKLSRLLYSRRQAAMVALGRLSPCVRLQRSSICCICRDSLYPWPDNIHMVGMRGGGSNIPGCSSYRSPVGEAQDCNRDTVAYGISS